MMIEPSNQERAELPETSSEYISDLESENKQQAEQITGLKDCVKADLAYLMRKDELNTTHVKANLIIQNEQALAATPQKEESDE